MNNVRKSAAVLAAGVLVVVAWSVWANTQKTSSQPVPSANDQMISNYAQEMLKQGKEIFRFDTFGDEAFWGDALRLHQAIAGEKLGGVGPGVSPKTALAVGLKVDLDALPASLVDQLKAGKVNLDDPATTLALLKLNSVVGVTGHFDQQGKLVSMGIQCALCHSTVDDALVPGIGHRLDGWGARDLNVGAIISLAPNLQPFSDLLGVDVATVKKVLGSWGPGCFDAELDKDGKGLRPDGKRACTLIPPAYGLAGVNLHTWTGFGSVPYWNAYVGATEMHGSGTFYDARLGDKATYPVASKSGSYNSRGKPDQLTSKLAALHFYQLAIPAPKPPAGSYDQAAAARGKVVFEGKGKCSTCHVPPLYTEPGNNLHAPSEIGVDSFQADRSPTHMYRTAPLAGLWSRQSRGFYHDGRFKTLDEVIQHYDQHLSLGLSPQEKKELVEFVKSL
jgi:hypothetical protein